jgi:hypothetical protein
MDFPPLISLTFPKLNSDNEKGLPKQSVRSSFHKIAFETEKGAIRTDNKNSY